jgi:holin-like protein
MPFALTVLIGAQLVTRAQGWLTPTESGPSALDRAATALISNMGLLFVPAGVGIIAELSILQREWLPIVTGLLVSTVLGLVVTGVVMHRITRRGNLNAVPSNDDSSEKNVQ